MRIYFRIYFIFKVKFISRESRLWSPIVPHFRFFTGKWVFELVLFCLSDTDLSARASNRRARSDDRSFSGINMQRVTRGVSSDSSMVGCTCTCTRARAYTEIYAEYIPLADRARTRVSTHTFTQSHTRRPRAYVLYTYTCACAYVKFSTMGSSTMAFVRRALVERNEKRGPPLRWFLFAGCTRTCVSFQRALLCTLLCFLQFSYFHICRCCSIMRRLERTRNTVKSWSTVIDVSIFHISLPFATNLTLRFLHFTRDSFLFGKVYYWHVF